MAEAEKLQSELDLRLRELLGEYGSKYLEQYWPANPSCPVAWADNAVLMIAYQEAALAVAAALQNSELRVLDVSTGPTLAPLLAIEAVVSEVQLSDFVPNNRQYLQELPIDYWSSYVPMLIRQYDYPERKESLILGKLDYLRRKSEPLHVDLFARDPFFGAVESNNYNLVSMNFVADSVTKTENEFINCFSKVTGLVQDGGGLFISATVDCTSWSLDGLDMPSPNVSEKTIVDFLKSQGFDICYLSRSMRLNNLSYSGGWIVLSAVRR
jgi:hypothetical protein